MAVNTLLARLVAAAILGDLAVVICSGVLVLHSPALTREVRFGFAPSGASLDRIHTYSSWVLVGLVGAFVLAALIRRVSSLDASLLILMGGASIGASLITPDITADGLRLWSAPVGEHFFSVWDAAFSDHVRTVIRDGEEISQSRYRAELLRHIIIGTLPCLPAAAVSWRTFTSKRPPARNAPEVR